jgi:hypothetical protein
MNNTLKFIIGLIVVIAVALAIYFSVRPDPMTPKPVTENPLVTQQESIVGCYTATLGKDVYTLTITDQNGSNVSGKLAFKNFEKDSSSGTFTGTYNNGILLGTYNFNSEGMNSNMQVAFKKTSAGFIRGFGDMDASGENFKDSTNLSYDTKYTFIPGMCK